MELLDQRVLAGELTLYALITAAGGSGVLALYLAGVVIGNRRPREAASVVQVHNGFA